MRPNISAPVHCSRSTEQVYRAVSGSLARPEFGEVARPTPLATAPPPQHAQGLELEQSDSGARRRKNAYSPGDALDLGLGGARHGPHRGASEPNTRGLGFRFGTLPPGHRHFFAPHFLHESPFSNGAFRWKRIHASCGDEGSRLLRRWIAFRCGGGIAPTGWDSCRRPVPGALVTYRDRPGRTCLDGAPWSRVWFRLCERFGCGHVFGLFARETNVPLALMLVRVALCPISKTRSLWRLPFSSGFRAESVGSHRFAVALDADRLAATRPPALFFRHLCDRRGSAAWGPSAEPSLSGTLGQDDGLRQEARFV